MRFAGLALLAAGALLAQGKLDPIEWSSAPAKGVPGGEFSIPLTAKIGEGWHLYSMTTPRPPIATTAKLEDEAVAVVEVYQPAPIRKLDPNFGVETETYEGTTMFYVRGKLKGDTPAGRREMTVNIRYQACTDKLCLPPKRKAIAVSMDVAPGASIAALPAGYALVPSSAAKPAGAQSDGGPAATPKAAAEQSMGQFLLLAFGFGLAAIFTPCVFPMIPVTMTFFLGQSQGKSRGSMLAQAIVFCLGIVVLFTGMGALITAAMGPFGVVQIASNPWVNGFIAAIFIALAFSMFGAFEITLPSGLLSRLDSASRGSGFVPTLLMGLTFSLTSFACVGPFVGTLLAASVTGDRLQPMLGMTAFATGLALPFFFRALFPSALNKLPKRGEWMARVKVVMGFLILAAALKYVANIDQVLQAGLLTRERFLALWFVLFTLPGLYLLGLLPMEGIRREENLSVGRLLLGTAFVAFAMSLLPGMVGGKLGELEAYVPLAAENSVGAPSSGEKLTWMKNDLPGALAKAKAEGKLVFVNFTGYACTNCHWMKANMFPRPEIREALSKFVLVELYTDGTDAASEANQKLQETKFQTVAIPYYAILDADEKVVASYPGLTKDPKEYLAFLNATGAQATAD